MTNPSPTHRLSAVGVSIWLDDLSRDILDSGTLSHRIEHHHVTGVTTNPSIFEAAIGSSAYDIGLERLQADGATVDEAATALVVEDVRAACDLLTPVWRSSAGRDGRVSIEVDPRLADDAAGTVEEAVKLWTMVARPNLMVKIPATDAGLLAIPTVLGRGISVNVTLIFSLRRYREVIDAYFTGLEQAWAADLDLSTIHSVASFFVSRVDVEIDKRLNAIGTPEALGLKARSGIANARLAYDLFEESLDSERARSLFASGGNPQRPLWASTGVKDPGIPDTEYVIELAAPLVVNTMPSATLDAIFEHGEVFGDTIHGTATAARHHLEALEALGISYDEVTALLESQAIAKFVEAWTRLLAQVKARLVPVPIGNGDRSTQIVE